MPKLFNMHEGLSKLYSVDGLIGIKFYFVFLHIYYLWTAVMVISTNKVVSSEPERLLQIPELTPMDMISNPIRFSLVIPTYNESANIAELVSKLSYLLDSLIPGEYELIVVDDDSPDSTGEIAQCLITEYPQLRVLRRTTERGLSSGVIRGWQIARGDILGVIDGDLQHPPSILLQMLPAALEGNDLVVASRHVAGGGVSHWSFLRRFLSRGAQILGLMILPEVLSRVSDPMSGFFMVRRTAIANKILNPVGYKILLEVIARGDIKQVSEVGYVFQERLEGKSKVTWKQYIDYLHHLIRLRFTIGGDSGLDRIGSLSQTIVESRFRTKGKHS